MESCRDEAKGARSDQKMESLESHAKEINGKSLKVFIGAVIWWEVKSLLPCATRYKGSECRDGKTSL